MFKIKESDGIALIAVVMLIVMVAIAVLGITVYVTNLLKFHTIGSARERAICAAQAGVMAAINDYVSGSYWTHATNASLGGNTYYSVGGTSVLRMSNFLRVDADSPALANDGGTNNRLQAIPLYNIHDNTSPGTITVDSMRLDWDFGGNLNRIVLGGTQRWSGSVSSGSTVNFSSNFSLNRRSSSTGTTNNTFRFTVTIPSDATVVATFFFTDGSSRKAYLLNNGRSGNNEFLITSTGEVRESIRWKRTIEATYDVGVNRITSWQEVQSHL